MHGRSAFVLGAVASSALALAACGGPSEAEKKAKRDRAVAAAKAAAARRQAATRHAKVVAAAQSCVDTTKPLVSALKNLNSRLDVGLNYNEYTNKVGDVKVAYDNADFANMKGVRALPCLKDVAVPAEKAFNQHAKAASAWSNCFDDVNCSNDDVKPTLQRHWLKASVFTDLAARGLARQQRVASP